MGGGATEASDMIDVYNKKPIKLTVKVEVPVKHHPQYNFVGRLLGPAGNTLKRLQAESCTKMAVLARGSMRDRVREEELRVSGNPEYQHLEQDLHVEVRAHARPADAYANAATALRRLEKLLTPINNANGRT